MTAQPNDGPDISSVNDEEFDRIWKQYTEIGLHYRNYMSVQGAYRGLASTWLLATLAGYGFILTKQFDPSFNSTLLAIALSFGSWLGIHLLWILDSLVYHRLLDATHAHGILLEKRYAWLPQIRTTQMKLAGNQGYLRRIAAYYLGLAGFPLIAGGFFLWAAMKPTQPWGLIVCISLALFCDIVVVLRTVRNSDAVIRQVVADL